jgi:predicted nucleic acid-binding protein
MIYLDSNVFLYPEMLEAKSGNAAFLSKEILKQVVEGRISAATCALTWDELFWVVKKKFGREIAARSSAKFLEFPNLKILKVDEGTIRRSQVLVDKYAVNPRDSIHAASCIEGGIEQIITDDPDFDKIEQIKRIGLKDWKSAIV